MKRLFSLFVLTITVVNVFAQFDIVQTNSGKVSGTVNATGDVHIFRGIPFAAPPVGELRWKAPQPVQPWSDVKKCDAFSASPMQAKPTPFMMYTPEFLIPEQPISEDCLYLNVWTAAKSSKEKRPVIVWIYGGGFVSGGSACAIYDGEELAKKGVVFVSINYRVGVFGFLAHPELSKESNGQGSGNFAFLDQIAALKWVQQNIAAFGGDPRRVTIAGQSAGSFSVNTLMASPVAKGLFQRAIGESGAMFNADGRALTLKAAEDNGIRFMQTVHANSIEDMRKISAEDLQKAAGSFASGPVIDGYVLTESVYDIFNAHKQNDVPLLTGWNGDEGFSFGKTPTVDEYKENAQKQYGELADEFLKVFPGNDSTQIQKSQFALGRDNLFAWQAYTWARMQSSKGKSKAFLYQFNHVSPGQETWGAFHTSEVPYALHTLHEWNLEWTDADKRLEDIISSYWVNFAKTGDPNGDGVPKWSAYNAEEDAVMVLNVGAQIAQPISVKDQFDFIDKYQEKLRTDK